MIVPSSPSEWPGWCLTQLQHMDTAHTAHACRPLPSLQGRWGGIGTPLVWGSRMQPHTVSHLTHKPWTALPTEQDLPVQGITWRPVGFGEKTQVISTLQREKRPRPPPPRCAGAIGRTLTPATEPTAPGFSLPEFALLSLNFLWNSDLAASKLSKEETLRRLWKLPPGRDRKKPHAGYDPRGPSTGGSCFGDECCKVGSASRLGLRSFSRRDSVSDCIQFSLGDVFKSLKIRESPPGFKTARRKRRIRRSPRVLGRKVREPG